MRKQNTIEKKFYSPDEVAVLLNVSRSTIDRMTNKGKFVRKLKIGDARCGFLVNEVNDWIAALPLAAS